MPTKRDVRCDRITSMASLRALTGDVNPQHAMPVWYRRKPLELVMAISVRHLDLTNDTTAATTRRYKRTGSPLDFGTR